MKALGSAPKILAVLAALLLLPACEGNYAHERLATGGKRASLAEPNDAQILSNKNEESGELLENYEEPLPETEPVAETAAENSGEASGIATRVKHKMPGLSVAGKEHKIEAPPEPPAEKPQAAIEETSASTIVDNGTKGNTVRVGVVSWRDLPFQTVKRQTYDYSCGAAAVATLMTYVYGVSTTEKAVFREMFERGDQEKIKREGFSMLDMSRYMNAHGLDARGYRVSEQAIVRHKLPFIALVNNNGYNHFVVVKSIGNGRILVGDPNIGSTEYARDDFARIWNGLALVVLNNASKAREAFDNRKEWRFARAHAPLRGANDAGIETPSLPTMDWQVALPVNNILPATLTGANIQFMNGTGEIIRGGS
ncbi:MAG: C39 family peptidase [Alphaproteobacteria bacterium]|nr:C39 family peptidase [Alphaproteobacteria bacterium]